MIKFSKTLLLAAGLAAIATSAVSQTPWEMKSGMPYM